MNSISKFVRISVIGSLALLTTLACERNDDAQQGARDDMKASTTGDRPTGTLGTTDTTGSHSGTGTTRTDTTGMGTTGMGTTGMGTTGMGTTEPSAGTDTTGTGTPSHGSTAGGMDRRTSDIQNTSGRDAPTGAGSGTGGSSHGAPAGSAGGGGHAHSGGTGGTASSQR
jgi:hypothetical protein